MVFFAILLILLAFWLARFFYRFSHGVSGVSIITKAKAGQIRIACVGDSITYGHGITGWPRNTYPYVLQKLLGNGFHVNNFGACGRSVQMETDRPYRKEPHYEKSLAYHGDIVIFMMGTNDAKLNNWHGPEAFRSALERMLDSYKDSQIVLCTPATAFPQNDTQQDVVCYDIQLHAVAQVDAIVREVSRERNLPLVDIQALTADHPEWYIADRIHPGNAGAAAIAEKIYGTIVTLL
jgi:lysophospholipase L1-like esterase